MVLSNSATPGIPRILSVDSCIHDGWLYFPKSKFSNEFLYLLFKNVRKSLIALGNGSIFTNLKTDILKNFNTILPDNDTLSKFDAIIKPYFIFMETNQKAIANLIGLRSALLPKLMLENSDICSDKLSFSVHFIIYLMQIKSMNFSGNLCYFFCFLMLINRNRINRKLCRIKYAYASPSGHF